MQDGGENPEEEDEEEAPAAGTENAGSSRDGDPRSNRDGKPHKKTRAGGRTGGRAGGTGAVDSPQRLLLSCILLYR